MKALIVIAAITVGGVRTASAGCEICDVGRKLQGGAYLHEELTLLTHVDDAPGDRPRTIDQIGLAGFRLHGFVGTGSVIGYHLGLDLAAGATTGRHGGFAYDIGFLPLGISVRFGASSFLTLGTGIVANGATGAIDDAIALPLDIDVELDANRVRLIGWARASWVAGSPQRHDGAPSAPFADELDAMLGLRIGHHYNEHNFPTGNGAYIGVAYKEFTGTKFLGLTFGYSMDMATRQRTHGEAADW